VALLKDKDREQLQKEFAQLQNSVKLVFFTQALDCEYCPMTQQVLEEVVGLSDKIQLQTHNFAIDKEQVAAYKIARVPAVAVVRVEPVLILAGGKAATRERDYGIRYYGVPAGFEFAALVGDIMDVSRGESGLSASSKTALAQLKEPLHLQVFTTPT
jgi:alkyl hydroperoxide reductase subunit AhpF